MNPNLTFHIRINKFNFSYKMNSSNYYDKLPAAGSPQIIVVEIRGFHGHFLVQQSENRALGFVLSVLNPFANE